MENEQHVVGYDEAWLFLRLVDACAKAGSQAAWAADAGVSRQYLCDVLAGRRAIGPLILAALGVEREVVYREVKRG